MRHRDHLGGYCLESKQEVISTWIRIAAMGTGEGQMWEITGRQNGWQTVVGKEEKQIGRIWAQVAKILNTGGGAWWGGKRVSSVSHTLRSGDTSLSTCNMNQPFLRRTHESGRGLPWVPQLYQCIFMDQVKTQVISWILVLQTNSDYALHRNYFGGKHILF